MALHEELLRSAYEAFNRRDIDAVLTLMQPDVDWPNGITGGRAHGHDEVRAYWTEQWSAVDPTVDPTGFEEDSSSDTAVLVHQVVRGLAGEMMDDRMVRHVYTITNGLIARMRILDA